MPSNHNTTTSSFLLFVNSVFDTETCGLNGIVKDGCVFVVANTPKVDYGVVRKDVLGTSSCVLGSASSDELCGIVVEEVFIDA